MHLQRVCEINVPIEDVFDYVSDFSNLFEWDDQVIEAQRMDLGPIKQGSQFLLKYTIGGRVQSLVYSLLAFKKNEALVFETKDPSFQTIDTIHFLEIGTKTRVEYNVHIEVKNPIVRKLLGLFMPKIANRVIERLKESLEHFEDEKKSKGLALYNLPSRFSSRGWNLKRKGFYATKSSKKRILITGPSSGIGLSATESLAGKGADLILLARNEEKLKSLIEDLKNRGFEGELESYLCDMSSLQDVHKTAQEILEKGTPIDVLINNAGALFDKAQSIDGIERSSVVNLISPWVLSRKLLPLMNEDSCIINVSSGGMYSVPLDLKELKLASEPFSGSKAYAYAKRALVLASDGLNEELKEKRIRVHSMHPGWVDTPGVVTSLPAFYRVTKSFLRTPFQGADTIVWLAMINPKEGGKFWFDREIQPFHILSSTQGSSEDYTRLKDFLNSFE